MEGDCVFHCCHRCRGLFKNQSIFKEHQRNCNKSLSLPNCEFFACTKEEFQSMTAEKNSRDRVLQKQNMRKRKLNNLGTTTKSAEHGVSDDANLRKGGESANLEKTKFNTQTNVVLESVQCSKNHKNPSGVDKENDSSFLEVQPIAESELPAESVDTSDQKLIHSPNQKCRRTSAKSALKRFQYICDDSGDEDDDLSSQEELGTNVIVHKRFTRSSVVPETKGKKLLTLKKNSCIMPKELQELITKTKKSVQGIEQTSGASDVTVDLLELFNISGLLKVSISGAKFACKFCNYNTKAYGQLKRHLCSHKENGDFFTCENCDFKAHFLHQLKTHIRTKHIKGYLCSSCSFQTSSSYKLKLHMLGHTGEKPLQCELCDYSCRQKKQLVTHARKHTGELLKCTVEGCAFTTIHDWALTNHRGTHDATKKYACDSCTYQTSDRSAYTRHQKIHTKEKNYRCPDCDYKAITKNEVTRHMRTHTKEKVYFCNKCSYSTAHPGSLRSHLMIHKNMKPFICSACQYSSIGKAKVQRHIERRHGGQGVIYKDLAANLGDVTMAQYRKKDQMDHNKGLTQDMKSALEATGDESISLQEGGQEVTLMYKCSSCDILFPTIEAFSGHLNDCQGKLHQSAAESIISLGQQ